MKIGLVSYRCENRNVPFNMSQIERAMQASSGKADVLCFGEAFLQGFDSLYWTYEKDRTIAVDLQSEEISQLRRWTQEYGISLIVGYIEREQDKLYSSCVVLSEGEIVQNYRRISRGWKEYTITDHHYCEGRDVQPFRLCGKEMEIALCGDLWDDPERFRTDSLLIWPVYVNFSLEEWNGGMIEEYAAQALRAADDTLMINSIDRDPVNHGGSFYFRNGKVWDQLPFDEEQILFVEIE